MHYLDALEDDGATTCIRCGGVLTVLDCGGLCWTVLDTDSRSADNDSRAADNASTTNTTRCHGSVGAFLPSFEIHRNEASAAAMSHWMWTARRHGSVVSVPQVFFEACGFERLPFFG